MAAELRNVVTLTLHESGSLRSRYVRIRGHRPRYARPPRTPHSLPRASCAILFHSPSLKQAWTSSLGGGFLRNPHSLPRASCANPFTLNLTWASSDSIVRKSLLRREGDSNPRNPFGVYTLSRRASSTTRASLLRRNWLARRNSPCEFGLPPLLLLTRAREALVRFSRLSVFDRL